MTFWGRPFMAALACLTLVQCGPQIATSNQATTYIPGSNADTSAAHAGQLNALRAQYGLGALRPHPALVRMAETHARDMQSNGFFGHVSSNGDTIRERADAQGYGYCHIAENLAKGQRDFATVLTQWMGSPSHRRNLMKEEVVDFGLIRGPGDLWVLVMGRSGC